MAMPAVMPNEVPIEAHREPTCICCREMSAAGRSQSCSEGARLCAAHLVAKGVPQQLQQLRARVVRRRRRRRAVPRGQRPCARRPIHARRRLWPLGGRPPRTRATRAKSEVGTKAGKPSAAVRRPGALIYYIRSTGRRSCPCGIYLIDAQAYRVFLAAKREGK